MRKPSFVLALALANVSLLSSVPGRAADFAPTPALTLMSVCTEIKQREACLENPNCNWDDANQRCVDIQFDCRAFPEGQCPADLWRAPAMDQNESNR